jgi:copper(I)-binding protein
MKLSPLALALALLLPALAAHADAILTLDHGTVWQTGKPGQNTQGFLEIHNTGNMPDTLTATNCTIADSTVLVDASGNKLQSLVIAPGQTVTFSGTGPHLLINNAHYEVAKYAVVPCAFTFAGAGSLIGYLNAILAPRN